jgi:hypothetical protein
LPPKVARILLKYPTRSRPELFKATMDRYLQTAEGELNVVLTIDHDDRSMRTPDIQDFIRERGIDCQIGNAKSKIQAINMHIPEEGWDILVLASDDHIPIKKGWDTQVRKDVAENPDHLIWYKDVKQDRICLMPVMDKAYYDRFKYIYHPSYKSLWCDNEQTEVAEGLGRLKKVDLELWQNISPDWGGSMPVDPLLRRNNTYFQKDKINYLKRRRHGFPI